MRASIRFIVLALALAVAPLGRAGSFDADDPLLSEQWHLHSLAEEPASANVRPAWAAATGFGVIIATVDDGLQRDHPDLHAAFVSASSYDFNDDDADPSPHFAGGCGTGDCHGTAVAGIAAARGGNGIGISGVAPQASLSGLRLLAEPISDEQIAAALAFDLDATAVSNNSWGPADDGATLAGPGPLTLAALEHAVATGRAGKGRVFVWAAGNGRPSDDDCNFDGYASSRFVIAVGATSDPDQVAPYSEPCAALMVVAPAGSGFRFLTTTDLVGDAGFDEGDYTSTFRGTSGATPVASGIVALMLQRNPSLTWRDVQQILVETSRRIDAADPGWSSSAFPHHHDYGFGLVDAEAAVAAAGSWVNLPPESASPSFDAAVALPIPDDRRAGAADEIVVGHELAGFRIEHVEIELTATHPRRGDLEVTLTSPAGTVSQLARPRPADTGADFPGWRFTSVRHWGETAAGSWTLRVADRAATNTGTFDGWRLRLYGVNGCSLVVDPSGARVGSAEGTGEFIVRTASGCGWSAESRSEWISLVSGASGVGTATVRYAVRAHSGALPRTGTIDVDGSTFEIVQEGAGATTVRLLTPVDGERLFVETPYRIAWRGSGSITSFDVLFSRDGGATYSPVPGCSALPATTRHCLWRSPGPPSARARLKVVANDASGGSAAAVSAFTLSPRPPWIRLARQRPGEQWLLGTVHRIEWRHNLGAESFVRVDVSHDGGRSWQKLARVRHAGSGAASYDWEVSGPVSGDVRFRVKWTRGPVADISDSSIAIVALRP